jgi:hypothetical protein
MFLNVADRVAKSEVLMEHCVAARLNERHEQSDGDADQRNPTW